MTALESWDIVPENGEDSSISDYSFGSSESEDSFEDLATPFNIKLLKESIETGSKVLDHIDGKNVVLVVGKTGTGKSTFIQGIAGKQIRETTHLTDCCGKAVKKSVYDAEDALADFTIGHVQSSQTKAFSCFVPPNEDRKEEVVYVDTPGFGDTHHEEIDIATSVMLSDIAKRCKSLRFVVLINFASFLEDRGGAARSMLRLTRSFVNDFSKNRKGFMFLFTHTGEIKGVSDNPSAAKDSVLDEILRLREGSARRDKDLLNLLEFLTISLQKNYPFVDVLHPLKSNFANFRKMVESKLSSINSPTIAETCGLMGTSRNRLAGEVKAILLRSNRFLQADPPDLESVKENHQLLEYLSDKIKFREVQDAASESKAVTDRFIQNSRHDIEEIIENGGMKDFALNTADAMDVRERLGRLDTLGEENLSKHLRAKIPGLVISISEYLNLKSDPWGHSDALKLNKLYSWSRAFPEHIFNYEEVLRQFNCRIATNTENLNKFEFHCGLSATAVPSLIRGIAYVNSVVQLSRILVDHELDIKVMEDAISCAFDSCGHFLSSSSEQISCELTEGSLDEDFFQRLEVRLGVVEALRSGFQSMGISEEISKNAAECIEHLHETILLKFEERCDGLKQRNINEAQVPLQQLQQILRRYHQITESASTDLHRIFQSLIDVMKEKLKSASVVLLQTMLPLDAGEIVTKGKLTGAALNDFADNLWFDEFLPDGSSIVASTCDKVYCEYEQRSKTIREQIIGLLDGFGRPYNSCGLKFVSSLEELTKRFLEIESFAKITKNTTILADCMALRTEMTNHVQRTAKDIEDSTMGEELNFPDAAQSEDRLAVLCTRMEEIKFLQAVSGDFACHVDLESTRLMVMSMADSLTLVINAIFENGTDFESMAKWLCMASALERNCGETSNTLFPSLAASKEQARVAISKFVQLIQQLIIEASNPDKIDECMAELQNALALDQFLNGEVAPQLKTVQALLESRESKIDSTIDQMIADENYLGIWEFLAPLAQSNDQLKRQKFRKYIRDIETSLRRRLAMVVDFVPHGLPPKEVTETVARHLDKLEEAHKAIFKQLEDEAIQAFRVDELEQALSREACSLKSKLNSKLRSSLRQMEADLANLNIARLTEDRTKILHFVSVTKKFIDSSQIEMHNKLEGDYESVIKSVPELVDEFFKSWFHKGQRLVSVLRSLKRVSLIDSAGTSSVSQLYNETRDNLKARLSDGIGHIEEVVTKHQCYGDGISALRSFQWYAESGLKDHVDSDIIVRVDELLELWDLQQKDCNAAFGRFLEEKTPAEIAAKLDELVPSKSSFWTRVLWYSGKEYKSLKKQTEEKCFGIYEKGITVLGNGDFATLNECVKNLSCWSKAVHKHISTITDNLKTLQDRVRKAFGEVCLQLRNALREKSIMRYKGLFLELRNFVLNAPMIFDVEDCQRTFTQTNIAFCEALEKQIDKVHKALNLELSFAFHDIKMMVDDARSFCDFMADHYAHLYEEMKHHHCPSQDIWVKRIAEVCSEHFDAGCESRSIRHYAVLGVMPSASYQEIKRAYRLKAMKFHPDKVSEKDDKTNTKFREIQEAWEALKAEVKPKKKFFDGQLKDFGGRLLDKVQGYLKTQQYGLVAQLLGRIYSLRELQELVSPPLDTKHIEETIIENVQGHIKAVRISMNSNWKESRYKELQQDIEDLQNMEKHFKSHLAIFQESWNDGITDKIKKQVLALENTARSYLASSQVSQNKKEDFRRLFLQMGSILVELPSLKLSTKQVMSSLLQWCLDKHWGYGYIHRLGLSLRDCDDPDENRVGQLLLSEFIHFKELNSFVWAEETIRKPIQVTMRDIRGYTQTSPESQEELAIMQHELLDHFDVFDVKYKKLLAEFLSADADLNALVHRTTKLAAQMQPLSCDKGWTTKVKLVIPELLAGVFALFTVLRSGDAYNKLGPSSETSNLKEALLMKPHDTQVSTLLAMFGCGLPSQDSLRSQLLQIRTGEGKSMILGAAATVLGLLGFRVRCVCYSEYLSNRDYRLFEDVFKQFQIVEDIVYSKIEGYAEDKMAAKGDIRRLVSSMLEGGPLYSSKTTSKPAKEEILLVDEVDVFFGENFYGQTCNLVTGIREPEVAEILQYIWNHYNSGRLLQLSDVKITEAYKSLVQKVKGFEFVLDTEIMHMVLAVNWIDAKPYFLDEVNQRIGYKQMDSVAYDVAYGYRTVFAYLREHDRGRIDDKTLERNLSLRISCGNLSYAEITPSRILGVSGTLDAMTRYEKEVLASYGVDTYLYLPSVYEGSILAFDRAGDGITIESSKSDFYLKICKDIKKVTDDKRAVIVFFKDLSSVNEFTSSRFYRKLGRQKKVLTEETSLSEKDFLVSKAATAKQITICPAVLGRGTDFFCKDATVEANGGVHVIQTFFSKQQSEEVQIQGRTARQGKSGSYKLILLEDDLLECFHVKKGEKDNIPKANWYTWLCGARDKLGEEHSKNVEKNVAIASKKHRATEDLFDALLAGNRSAAASLFKRVYRPMG